MTVIRLQNLLDSTTSGPLESIVRKAADMDRLTTLLRAALPAELADNLVAASVRANAELAIIASTSAWAAKLRFEESRLLEATAAAGIAVSRCRISVSRSA